MLLYEDTIQKQQSIQQNLRSSTHIEFNGLNYQNVMWKATVFVNGGKTTDIANSVVISCSQLK